MHDEPSVRHEAVSPKSPSIITFRLRPETRPEGGAPDGMPGNEEALLPVREAPGTAAQASAKRKLLIGSASHPQLIRLGCVFR